MIIRRHRQNTAIWGRVGPNTLRNSFITALLASACDIRFIQALLGLSSVNGLDRYLPTDIEALKREHAKHFTPLDDAAT